MVRNVYLCGQTVAVYPTRLFTFTQHLTTRITETQLLLAHGTVDIGTVASGDKCSEMFHRQRGRRWL